MFLSPFMKMAVGCVTLTTLGAYFSVKCNSAERLILCDVKWTCWCDVWRCLRVHKLIVHILIGSERWECRCDFDTLGLYGEFSG